MKLFDRYLARTVMATTLIVAFVLVGLYTFFSFVAELKNVGSGDYSLFKAGITVLLEAPQGLYDIFPVIVLLGTLLGLGGLAAGSELVVLRASGVSVLRMAGSALLAGVILAGVCFGVGNWLAPHGAQLAQRIRAHAHSGDAGALSGQSLWLRQGSDFVHIDRLLTDSRVAGIQLYQEGPGPSLSRIVTARSARYEHGHWQLHGVTVTRFGSGGVDVRDQQQMQIAAHIKPKLLRLFVVQPQNLSTGGLYRYARFLRANDLDAGRYMLAFWRKLAMPVTVLVMILLAVPFAFGPLRSAGVGQRLFVGVLAGLAFYTFNEIVANTGEVMGLTPWLTAWAPTAVLGVLALWRLRAAR